MEWVEISKLKKILRNGRREDFTRKLLIELQKQLRDYRCVNACIERKRKKLRDLVDEILSEILRSSPKVKKIEPVYYVKLNILNYCWETLKNRLRTKPADCNKEIQFIIEHLVSSMKKWILNSFREDKDDQLRYLGDIAENGKINLQNLESFIGEKVSEKIGKSINFAHLTDIVKKSLKDLKRKNHAEKRRFNVFEGIRIDELIEDSEGKKREKSEFDKRLADVVDYIAYINERELEEKYKTIFKKELEKEFGENLNYNKKLLCNMMGWECDLYHDGTGELTKDAVYQRKSRFKKRLKKFIKTFASIHGLDKEDIKCLLKLLYRDYYDEL
jgi:hypothetical protein